MAGPAAPEQPKPTHQLKDTDLSPFLYQCWKGFPPDQIAKEIRSKFSTTKMYGLNSDDLPGDLNNEGNINIEHTLGNYKVARLSNKGRRIKNNDAFLIDALPLGENLFIIADGVGDEEKGGKAAQIATQKFREAYLQNRGNEKNEAFIKLAMVRAATAANTAVNDNFNLAGNLSPLERTATTLTACILLPTGKYYIFHIGGENRGYQISGNGIKQITQDQTSMEKRPILDDDNRLHGYEDVEGIDRAIGLDKMLLPQKGNAPYFINGQLKPNDQLLLCTDELWKEIGRRKRTTNPEEVNLEIKKSATLSLDQAVSLEYLFQNATNIQDNMTAILAKFSPSRPILVI